MIHQVSATSSGSEFAERDRSQIDKDQHDVDGFHEYSSGGRTINWF